MANEKQALVIGFGSTLRGDDALGRIACERLRDVVDPQQVKVVDQAAPTPELAAEVAAASLVIFLDASIDGPAGEVVARRLTAADSSHAMAHSLNPNRSSRSPIDYTDTNHLPTSSRFAAGRLTSVTINFRAKRKRRAS